MTARMSHKTRNPQKAKSPKSSSKAGFGEVSKSIKKFVSKHVFLRISTVNLLLDLFRVASVGPPESLDHRGFRGRDKGAAFFVFSTTSQQRELRLKFSVCHTIFGVNLFRFGQSEISRLNITPHLHDTFGREKRRIFSLHSSESAGWWFSGCRPLPPSSRSAFSSSRGMASHHMEAHPKRRLTVTMPAAQWVRAAISQNEVDTKLEIKSLYRYRLEGMFPICFRNPWSV